MIRRSLRAVAFLAAVALAGCSSTATPIVSPLSPADLSTIFKNGCAGVSVADGAFKAASPALVASGKLTAADVTKEGAIFASVQGTCANPPADLATAGITLVGDAASIYLLLAPPLGS